MKHGQTINLAVRPQYSGKEQNIAEPEDVKAPSAGKERDTCCAPSQNDIIWEGGLSDVDGSSAPLKGDGGDD